MSTAQLKEALKDSKDPIPGFLVNEIIRHTYVSCNECERIQSTLIKGLAHPSPHVVARALTVIRECTLKGQDAFRWDMKRHHDALRGCALYQGKEDPLYGDAFIRRVQELGAECLDAVMNHSAPTSVRDRTADVSGSRRQRIVGHGLSDAISSKATILGTGETSRWKTFGKIALGATTTVANSAGVVAATAFNQYAPEKVQSKVKDTASWLFPAWMAGELPKREALFHFDYVPPEVPDLDEEGILPSRGTRGNVLPEVPEEYGVSELSYLRTLYQPPKLQKKLRRQATENPKKTHKTRAKEEKSAEQNTTKAAELSPEEAAAAEAKKRRKSLRVLVRVSLRTALRGRLRPAHEEIVQFCEVFQTCEEAVVVAKELNRFLAITVPWRMRVRALYFIEAVLRRGAPANDEERNAVQLEFKRHFDTHPKHLERLLSVTQTSVTRRAEAVVKRLSLDVELRENPFYAKNSETDKTTPQTPTANATPTPSTMPPPNKMESEQTRRIGGRNLALVPPPPTAPPTTQTPEACVEDENENPQHEPSNEDKTAAVERLVQQADAFLGGVGMNANMGLASSAATGVPIPAASAAPKVTLESVKNSDPFSWIDSFIQK